MNLPVTTPARVEINSSKIVLYEAATGMVNSPPSTVHHRSGLMVNKKNNFLYYRYKTLKPK
ncbi:MAG TPA: hypothetical protein VFW07_13335 [Parafilimonas sp.]|nr:hypothetical protein [Parafilimonas sp.]